MAQVLDFYTGQDIYAQQPEEEITLRELGKILNSIVERKRLMKDTTAALICGSVLICMAGASLYAGTLDSVGAAQDGPYMRMAPAAFDITISNGEQKPVVTLKADGAIITGEGASKDKATRAFLEALSKVYPEWINQMKCSTQQK